METVRPQPQLSQVRSSTAADTVTKTSQGDDVSAYETVRSYAKQWLHSTTRSLNALAQTVREKHTDWKTQKKVKKQALELEQLRSLLLFTHEWKASPLPSTAEKEPGKKVVDTLHPGEISPRVTEKNRPRMPRSKSEEATRKVQQGQSEQPSSMAVDSPRIQAELPQSNEKLKDPQKS